MGRRLILILAAVALVAAGATGMYLAVSIPNDIQAEALLRKARTDLQGDRRDQARSSLEEIIRKYPRTNAAAAATTGLFAMVTADQRSLQKNVNEQLDLIQKLAERQARRAAVAALAAPPAEETATSPPAGLPAVTPAPPPVATKPSAKPSTKKRSTISIRRSRKRR